MALAHGITPGQARLASHRKKGDVPCETSPHEHPRNLATALVKRDASRNSGMARFTIYPSGCPKSAQDPGQRVRFRRSRPDLHVEAVNPTAQQQALLQSFLTNRAIWVEPHPAAKCTRLNRNLNILFGFGHGQLSLPRRFDASLPSRLLRGGFCTLEQRATMTRGYWYQRTGLT